MFLNFCYFLNVLKLSWLAALLRFLMAQLLRGQLQERSYNIPIIGWAGWVEAPMIGVLAFIPEEEPKRRIYRW